MIISSLGSKMGTIKTPVSILNEMMSKIGSTVIYEQCPTDQNSTTATVFSCKVICDGVTAIGSGHSKKDAKQHAAQAMLDQIQKQTVIIKPPIHSVLDSTVIQELKKLCAKYEFGDPVYTDLDATGPPHARYFSVQCSVSTLTEVGTATTKKQAKVDAANKMIKKIKDTFSVNNLLNKDSSKTKKNMDQLGDSSNNNISKSKHKKSVDESAKLKINYNLKASSKPTELINDSQDLALALSSKLEHLQNSIKECQQNINDSTVTKVKQEFQNVMDSVKIDFHHMILQTEQPKTCMMIIQLNTTPDIFEMSLGSTREEAELRTINKVIQSLCASLE